MQLNFSSPLGLQGLRVTQNAYFSLITHTKELLLVTVCDDTAGIGSWKGTAEFKDGNPHTSRQYLQINKPRRGIWADRREE